MLNYCIIFKAQDRSKYKGKCRGIPGIPLKDTIHGDLKNYKKYGFG